MSAVGGLTNSVMVGVDESDSMLQAVVWGAREASRRGADLILLLAFSPVSLSPRSGDADADDADRARAAFALEVACTLALETTPHLRVRTRLIDGLPVPVLTEAARRCDLLVIGSHGASRLSVALLGSTARALSAAGSGPVVVVRGPDPETLPETGVLPVVVGVDGSAESRRAAQFAAEEARLTHVPLLVTHVDVDSRSDKAAVALFEDLLRSYPRQQMQYRRLSGGPAEALVDISTEARLLVVGSRGKGGFAGLFGGSVSQELTRRAQCPIAIVPPTMRARAWAPAEHRSPAKVDRHGRLAPNESSSHRSVLRRLRRI